MAQEDNNNKKEDQEDDLIIVENKKDLITDDEDEDDDKHQDDGDADQDHTDKAVKETDEEEGKDSDDDILAQRRRERKERKERKEKAIKRDKAELEFMRKRNEDLEKRLSRVEVSNQESQLSQIDQALEKANNDIALAERIMAKAVDAKNGADLVKATQIRDAARDRAQQLNYVKHQATQQAQRPNNTGLDAESAQHAQKFLADHKWYKPQGGGEETAIVLAIDASLVQEGYDSKTEEYWDELRSRVKRRLPEYFKGQNNDGREPPAPRRQAGGPNLGSGRNTSTSAKQVYISPERKQAMIEAGIWDDPVLRKKMVRQYQKYDQEARNTK